jgi:multidrug transporter EmrE-like cation transporter
MTVAGFLLVLSSVSLSAAAQTAFKLGVNRVTLPEASGVFATALTFLFSPLVLLGLGLYGVGTVLWLFALRQMDLSLAYPFVAVSFVMVSLSGILVLGEAVNLYRLSGLALIILGLLVMAKG